MLLMPWWVGPPILRTSAVAPGPPNGGLFLENIPYAFVDLLAVGGGEAKHGEMRPRRFDQTIFGVGNEPCLRGRVCPIEM